MGKAKKSNLTDKQKKLYGTKVLYIGVGDKKITCPVCGVSKKKAMISEYKNVSYCSEECVVSTIEQ